MKILIELEEWVANRIRWNNCIENSYNWAVTQAILEGELIQDNNVDIPTYNSNDYKGEEIYTHKK